MGGCVIGVGNELRRDDAVGLEVVKRLHTLNLKGIDFFCLGNGLFSLANIIGAYQRVMVIDSLPPGFEPGKVILVNIAKEYMLGDCYSLHDFDLLFQLQQVLRNGFGGTIRLLGIETVSLDYGFGLSAALTEKLPQIVADAEAKVRRFFEQPESFRV